MKVLIILCCALVGLVTSSSREAFFVKVGSYTGKNADGISYSKDYYVPKTFRASWQEARLLCISYGMELARLETLNEHNAVRGFCNANKDILTAWNLVDGGSSAKMTVVSSKDDWYFEDGRKVPYAIDWAPGVPDYAHQKCWSLASNSNFQVNDIGCYESAESFICQELTAF